jgi:hypothetical protein
MKSVVIIFGFLIMGIGVYRLAKLDADRYYAARPVAAPVDYQKSVGQFPIQVVKDDDPEDLLSFIYGYVTIACRNENERGMCELQKDMEIRMPHFMYELARHE